jgi:hypothetical protein
MLESHKSLPLTEFHRNKKGTKSGLSYYCKRCATDSQLRHKYGITIEKYEEMLKEQEGKCALCGTTKPGGSPGSEDTFRMDHIKGTKIIRRLLCDKHNLGFGFFKDDPALMLKGMIYLLKRGYAGQHKGEA